MCEPSTLFAMSTAMALGSAVIGMSSDVSGYNKKVGAINAEAEAINKSTIFRYQMAGLQEQQSQDRAEIQAGESRLKLTEAEGTATAAAASGGVEGNSVDALLHSFAVSTGSDISHIYTQRDNEVSQVQAEKKGTEIDARNRITALKHEIPDDPTTKMLGRLFSAAFQTGSAYIANTTRVGKGEGGGLFGRRFG